MAERVSITYEVQGLEYGFYDYKEFMSLFITYLSHPLISPYIGIFA